MFFEYSYLNELITLVSVIASFCFINISEEILDRYYHNRLSLREQVVSAVLIIFGLRIASLWPLALLIVTAIVSIAVVLLRRLMPQMSFSGYSVAVAGAIIQIIRAVETKTRENIIFMVISLVITVVAGIIIARAISVAADEEEDEEEEEQKEGGKALTILGVCLTVVIVTVATAGVVAYAIYAFTS